TASSSCPTAWRARARYAPVAWPPRCRRRWPNREACGSAGVARSSPGPNERCGARRPGASRTRCWISREDHEQYYLGFANRTLWPLLHYRPSLLEYRRADLAGYQRVNRLFAEHLAPLLKPDDVVWIHDYHLFPLASELRRHGVG